MSKPTPKTTAIIVAAGSSQRMGKDVNKQFLLVNDVPVLARTLLNFAAARSIDEIIVVTKQENILTVSSMIKDFDIKKISAIIPGGKTRQESVSNGLNQLKWDGFVAIHDGARPFATPSLIDSVVSTAHSFGAAAPGIVPKDTIKIVNGNSLVSQTPDRDTLRAIQTPQVFRTDELKLAYIRAIESGFEGTDDCSVAEKAGISVCITEGEPTNIKVTTPEDLSIAEAICTYLDKL